MSRASIASSQSPRFNSRTPGGVRRVVSLNRHAQLSFQFTHPGRGATDIYPSLCSSDLLFQFTHPGRGATQLYPSLIDAYTFQFTHPGRGATPLELLQLLALAQFQFTHPGRGATTICPLGALIHTVSIHAPREGCDAHRQASFPLRCSFNSRTPGGVRLLNSEHSADTTSSFNSRTPGGVRHTLGASASRRRFRFNSRTPGGVRRVELLHVVQDVEVSIHAPREGCDRQSPVHPRKSEVSIHAPREGCDGRCTARSTRASSFNSRTPGGVRRV